MTSILKISAVAAALVTALVIAAIGVVAALAFGLHGGAVPNFHLIVDGETVDLARGGHGAGLAAAAIAMMVLCALVATLLVLAPMLLALGLALMLVMLTVCGLLFGVVMLVPLLPLVALFAVVWWLRRRRNAAQAATIRT
jgi:hypothetical protein